MVSICVSFTSNLRARETACISDTAGTKFYIYIVGIDEYYFVIVLRPYRPPSMALYLWRKSYDDLAIGLLIDFLKALKIFSVFALK